MSKTIMIADDSATVRQVVQQVLSADGYTVLEAADGEEAFSSLGEKPVDMLITDLNMPKMDGLQLIRAVRGNAQMRFMPIVMLTTERDPDKKMAAKDAGASGWIEKPFRPEQLLSVVKKVCP